MIHLVAGESALGTLRETSVPGDKFSIDDILMEGPIVDGLRSRSSWEYRAEFLQRDFSIEKSWYLAGRDECDRILDESLQHDEIVLWFEFDLFCQANLLYYLNWYASRDLGKARLSLICPEAFPGRPRFRGLGELHAEESESLFPTRAEVTADQKRIAQLAWQSYANDDPRAIEKFLQSDSSVLPRVAPAFRAHLERFPSTTNGLGSLGQKTLEILNEQPVPFPRLFVRVSNTPEVFRHGMGDMSFQAYLDMWGSGANPLVHETDVVEITEASRDVVLNQADAIQLNGIDLWYGGVHLTRENLWRWNSAQQKMEH
jgi:Domain of unknown function (DUF1835)